MEWTITGSIQGPQGEPGAVGEQGLQGAQGNPGPRGTKWFAGDGVPTTVVGSQTGDWYLDNLTGDIHELS